MSAPAQPPGGWPVGNGVSAALSPPGVPVHPSDGLPRTLDLELDPPVVGSNNTTYTHLHLEEPTCGMCKRAEAELAAGANLLTLRNYQIALVSLAANVPRDVVEKMRVTEVQRAGDFLAPFVAGSGPQIGPT